MIPSSNGCKIFFILLAKFRIFYVRPIIINIKKLGFEKLYLYYFS